MGEVIDMTVDGGRRARRRALAAALGQSRDVERQLIARERLEDDQRNERLVQRLGEIVRPG